MCFAVGGLGMTKKLLVLLVIVVCVAGFSGCLRKDPTFREMVIQNWKDDLYWADHDLDWILALRRPTTLHWIQQ